MSFFNNAFANDAVVNTAGSPATTNNLMNLLPMVAIVGIFYFLLIRPSIKKQKEAQNMISSLKKGDNIITIGGIIGNIREINEQELLIVSDNTTFKITKSSVAEKIEKEKQVLNKPSNKK